jgi:hypothetical protein
VIRRPRAHDCWNPRQAMNAVKPKNFNRVQSICNLVTALYVPDLFVSKADWDTILNGSF